LALDTYMHSGNDMFLGTAGVEARYQCEHGSAADCMVYGQYLQWSHEALGVFVGQVKLAVKFGLYMTGAYAAAVFGPGAAGACIVSAVVCMRVVDGGNQAANGDPSPSGLPGDEIVGASRAGAIGEEAEVVAKQGAQVAEAEVATGAATSRAVATEAAGGSVDDVLGGLAKGKQSTVRTVASDAELQTVWDDLAAGGSPVEVPGYKGSWVERPDGVRLGLREASKSGGRTIDIRYPDGTIRKVHVG
jgi:hypothetical protein